MASTQTPSMKHAASPTALALFVLAGVFLVPVSAHGDGQGNGAHQGPPPAGTVAPPPAAPTPSGGQSRPTDVTPQGPSSDGRPRKPDVVSVNDVGGPSPGRRRGSTPASPTPGVWVAPTGPRTPDLDLDPSALRGWELWWSLHRDRFTTLKPRDLTRAVGLIPPDPRTSVQAVEGRVSAFERIEPSLRLLINHERSELVLARALIAIAKLGEDPKTPGSRAAFTTILPFLYRSDAQVSDAAIMALGILGTEEALFTLGQFAGVAPSEASRSSAGLQPTDRQRALALYAMGMIGGESDREDVRRLAASRICNLFTQDAGASAEVKFAALHAISLIPLGDDAAQIRPDSQAKSAPDKFNAKSRQAKRYRGIAASAIPSASRRAQVGWVLAVLDDPREEDWIRAQAATAAARLCGDLPEGSALTARVVERLLAAIASRTLDSVQVGQSAVLALGELGDADSDELDARVRSALESTISGASDQSMREFALLCLAQVGSRPGGPQQEADRLDASTDVRRVLLHRIASARAGQLPWAILALGLFEHGMIDADGASAPQARAALVDLLAETRSAEIAGVCSLALGLSGATEANRDLIARLRDGDPRVRGYAATALGMLRAREAGISLERLLDQARTTPELYRPVGEALAAIGAPVGRQLLSLMAGGASLESQMNLCSTLGRVGDWRSLAALSEVACDQNSLVWVRAAATSALGNLGSRRSEPWNVELGHALNFNAVPTTLRSVSLDGLLDIE